MEQYIKLYHNGTELTGENVLTSPVLNATNNEISEPMLVEAKAIPGFKTYGATTVKFVGEGANMWDIALIAEGNFSPSLTIDKEIAEAGVSFYVRAKSVAGEAPKNDTSTQLVLETVIQAI